LGRRLLFGSLWGAASYLAGAPAGGLLTTMLPSNTHDKSMEAVMTGAFYTGPLAAVLGFVLAAALTKPPKARP
jgi:uncharacterized membrane protein YfcA